MKNYENEDDTIKGVIEWEQVEHCMRGLQPLSHSLLLWSFLPLKHPYDDEEDEVDDEDDDDDDYDDAADADEDEVDQDEDESQAGVGGERRQWSCNLKVTEHFSTVASPIIIIIVIIIIIIIAIIFTIIIIIIIIIISC